MEMTIDDCIKELLINKEDDTYVLGNETIDFAIETMRKYQKITQIINAELEEYHPLDRNFYRLALIKEVLKDGSTN